MLMRKLDVPCCSLDLCFIRPIVPYNLNVPRQLRFSTLHSARLPYLNTMALLRASAHALGGTAWW